MIHTVGPTSAPTSDTAHHSAIHTAMLGVASEKADMASAVSTMPGSTSRRALVLSTSRPMIGPAAKPSSSEIE